jgi:Mn2+/Fe2+ NRAMP family transporter
MNQDTTRQQETLLHDARAQGRGATLRAFVRLSGPGWLQSAITLGGGSLASALYLGVLTGYRMLWLQVLAMLLGIVMLAAIAYVTLSTGERPFRAMREHVNPVLAWGWIIAVLLANLVWALPQFALGTAAVQQNLVPALAGTGGKLAICAGLLAAATAVIWSYDSGAKGMRLFERVLKAMVGVVVVSFFGVALTLAFSGAGLPWGDIARGLLPDPGLLRNPAAEFEPYLAGSSLPGFWRARIVSEQQDVMIAAFATAVGINMTFLLPYSMLKKGWNRAFRGLAVFDLSTGLLVPFVLATGCVVLASANRFHARADPALVSDAALAARSPAYLGNLDARIRAGVSAGDGALAAVSLAPALRAELGAAGYEQRVRDALAALPEADRQLASMLVKRDAFGLASALEPMTGRAVAQYVFGIGVLGMALSTIIILMLISGFTFCELFDVPPTGWPHRLGCLAAGLGVLGPFVWTGEAKFWLAVPTSNFGMVLLPVAYWSFFLMMNSAGLLGDQRPRGRARAVWNGLMIVAAGVATFASLATLWKNLGWVGLASMGAFLALALGAHVLRARQSSRTSA